MAISYKIPANLNYLNNEPKIINWKVVRGSGLTNIQSYDVIFDDIDLKIRKMV